IRAAFDGDADVARLGNSAKKFGLGEVVVKAEFLHRVQIVGLEKGPEAVTGQVRSFDFNAPRVDALQSRLALFGDRQEIVNRPLGVDLIDGKDLNFPLAVQVRARAEVFDGNFRRGLRAGAGGAFFRGFAA